MRFVSMALLIAAPLLAQDADPSKAEALTFRFSCRQGWDLACVVGEVFTKDALAKLPVVTADSLLEGVPNPRVTGPGLAGGMSAYEWSAWKLDETRRRWSRDVSRDPIQLDGRAVLSTLGVPRIQLDSLKYRNMTLKWEITFEEGGDVRADVGGPSRTVAKRRWAEELERVQGEYRTALLKMGTPQEAEKRAGERTDDRSTGSTPDPVKDATDHSVGDPVKSGPAASKSGGDDALKAMEPILRRAGTSVSLGAAKADRLYHFCALEEQYVALVLAEIPGHDLDEAYWKEAAKLHGTRIVSQARQAVDRLVRHARGTLAPGAPKVVGAKWDSAIPAVPSFAWTVQGVADREGLVKKARARLTELAEASQSQPMPQRDWEVALVEELRRINELIRLHSPAEATGRLDEIRWPIVFERGTGTYSYTEQPMKSSAPEPGAVEIGSQGTAHAVTVFFFDSGLNRYVPSNVEYRTWYRGWVKRDAK